MPVSFPVDFTTMAVINPPERKLAKRTSVGCTVHYDWLKVWKVTAPVLLNFKLYLGHYDATKYYYNYHSPEALFIKKQITLHQITLGPLA